MSNFGPLLDAFERVMAAVAFAESNDRETALWMMMPDSSREPLRAANQASQQASSRPELRM